MSSEHLTLNEPSAHRTEVDTLIAVPTSIAECGLVPTQSACFLTSILAYNPTVLSTLLSQYGGVPLHEQFNPSAVARHANNNSKAMLSDLDEELTKLSDSSRTIVLSLVKFAIEHTRKGKAGKKNKVKVTPPKPVVLQEPAQNKQAEEPISVVDKTQRDKAPVQKVDNTYAKAVAKGKKKKDNLQEKVKRASDRARNATPSWKEQPKAQDDIATVTYSQLTDQYWSLSNIEEITDDQVFSQLRSQCGIDVTHEPERTGQEMIAVINKMRYHGDCHLCEIFAQWGHKKQTLDQLNYSSRSAKNLVMWHLYVLNKHRDEVYLTFIKRLVQCAPPFGSTIPFTEDNASEIVGCLRTGKLIRQSPWDEEMQ